MKREEAFTGNNEQTNPLATPLQQLLADLQIHYMNLRGYHWNITGPNFFTLHGKFEEMYLHTAQKADEIAERLLALGHTPCNRYSQYLQHSKIEEIHAVSCDETAIDNLLKTNGYLITSQRKLIAIANATGDEVTADIITGYLKEQEKTVWMLTAYLS